MSIPGPDTALIIAVYKNHEALRKVLLSVQNQTFDNFEVVVADDGSGPEVFQVVKGFEGRVRYPIRHVWHEDEGFRKTVIVNRAVVATPASYLIFIDGDCILHRRFVERHVGRRKIQTAHFGRRVALNEQLTRRVSEEDVMAGRLENPLYWWGKVVDHSAHHGLYAPWLYKLRNRKSRYSLLGSNFSIHKEDYLSVNGYDERILGRGLEDSNLWPRLLLAGIEGKRISQEALQYHLYHPASPVPHDPETIKFFCSPTEAYTLHGVVRPSEGAS